HVAQPVNAVALHQPHRSGIVVGPHALRPVALGRTGQALGDLVEGGIPQNRSKGIAAHALLADPAQWLREAVRVVLALGIAGDLGADHTSCVALRQRPSDPPDAAPGKTLDPERAGARAIVRADAGNDVE